MKLINFYFFLLIILNISFWFLLRHLEVIMSLEDEKILKSFYMYMIELRKAFFFVMTIFDILSINRSIEHFIFFQAMSIIYVIITVNRFVFFYPICRSIIVFIIVLFKRHICKIFKNIKNVENNNENSNKNKAIKTENDKSFYNKNKKNISPSKNNHHFLKKTNYISKKIFEKIKMKEENYEIIDLSMDDINLEKK